MDPVAAQPLRPTDELRARLVAALPREPRRRSLRWLVRGVVVAPFLVALACVLMPALAAAQTPGIRVDLGTDGGGASSTLQLLALLTVLSLAPSIVIMMTSFTRIIIVLGFIRNAVGTQGVPPNQVLVGVALFLTMFVMGPTFTQVNDQAIQPLIENRISEQTAIQRAEALCEVLGIERSEATEPKADPMLLMEMMEQREALGDARRAKDLDQVEKLAASIAARQREVLTELTRRFAALSPPRTEPGAGSAAAGSGGEAPGKVSETDREQLLRELGKLRYFRRFLDEASAILDELE